MPIAASSAEQLRRAGVIANAPEFRARVGQALAARFPEDPDAPTPPVEKQIYGGFYSHADKALLAEFQWVDWPRRQEIVATLSDARLRQLGVALWRSMHLSCSQPKKVDNSKHGSGSAGRPQTHPRRNG